MYLQYPYTLQSILRAKDTKCLAEIRRKMSHLCPKQFFSKICLTSIEQDYGNLTACKIWKKNHSCRSWQPVKPSFEPKKFLPHLCTKGSNYQIKAALQNFIRSNYFCCFALHFCCFYVLSFCKILGSYHSKILLLYQVFPKTEPLEFQMSRSWDAKLWNQLMVKKPYFHSK